MKRQAIGAIACLVFLLAILKIGRNFRPDYTPPRHVLDHLEARGQLAAETLIPLLNQRPVFLVQLDPTADSGLARQSSGFRKALLAKDVELVGQQVVGIEGPTRHMQIFEMGIPAASFELLLQACPKNAVLISLAGFPDLEELDAKAWTPSRPAVMIGLSFRIPKQMDQLIEKGLVEAAILANPDAPITPASKNWSPERGGLRPTGGWLREVSARICCKNLSQKRTDSLRLRTPHSNRLQCHVPRPCKSSAPRSDFLISLFSIF